MRHDEFLATLRISTANLFQNAISLLLLGDICGLENEQYTKAVLHLSKLVAERNGQCLECTTIKAILVSHQAPSPSPL